MPETMHLKIYGNGDFEAEIVALSFSRIVEAYNSLLYLDFAPFVIGVVGNFSTEDAIRAPNLDPLRPSRLITAVSGPSLRLISVEFHSPGYWEFLGKLNPLEVIRQYINDRHNRKKDIDYRNHAEKRKLDFENEKLSIENAVLKFDLVQRFISTCRDAGIPDSEITVLIKEHALIPLMRLDSLVERDLITYAEATENANDKVEVETT